MAERRFRYAPRPRTQALGMLFFGGGAVFMLIMAAINHRGMRLLGFTLDPGQADVFFAVLGVLSAAFTALIARAHLQLRGRERFVVLRETEIVVPGVPSRPDQTIAWNEIESVTERSVYRQRFIDIRYRGGKASLTASMLGDDAYGMVRAILLERSATLPSARVVR